MPKYQERTYRRQIAASDLVSFEVKVAETDLFIAADRSLQEQAEQAVRKYREQLEAYIASHPRFKTSLSPQEVSADPEREPSETAAPEIIRAMAEAGEKAGVGPMAAVAGAIAEFVGRDLLNICDQVIVENGGDIYIRTLQPRTIAIFAGDSPLSNRVGLAIAPEQTPLGVCTSSGTVGPSLSLGFADAVAVVAPSTPLADAAATALGNLVKTEADIEKATKAAQNIEGIAGVVVIKGEKLGAWGQVELVKL